MSDYTPTTDNVRGSYVGWADHGRPDEIGQISEMGREFDRWIQGLRHDIWNEGYMAGSDYQREYERLGEDAPGRGNPYVKNGSK